MNEDVKVPGFGTADIPWPGCTCGPRGHEVLAAALDAPERVAFDSPQLRVGPVVLRRLRDAGAAIVLIGSEGGWARGMFSVELTAAGYAHITDVLGMAGRHVGFDGCGSPFDVLGKCTGCSYPRPLTDTAASARLDATPAGASRNAEAHAVGLSCPRHGYARASQVTTSKTCLQCGNGFDRR